MSFIHIFKQKGYKCIGNAKYQREGDENGKNFFDILRPLAGQLTISGVIVVNVHSAQTILAPSYRFCQHTTEQTQIIAAKKTYGVN